MRARRRLSKALIEFVFHHRRDCVFDLTRFVVAFRPLDVQHVGKQAFHKAMPPDDADRLQFALLC